MIDNMSDSVHKSVAKQIADLIETGNLKKGDKLPPERSLAEKFKVSRSSIREAIKSLAQKNLVESRRGDGTYILAEMDADIFEAFTSVFTDQRKRLNDIFQFRLVVEPEIAALAAMAIDDQTLDRMKVIVCNQQIKYRNGEDPSELDTKFHLEIAKATGNAIFPEMLTALGKIMRESRSEFLQTPARKKQSIAAHFKLLEALEKRDAALARQVMKHHIKEVESVATHASTDK
ncbi:FadR/GntR family transcriptional regulator [Maridesulfovibrio hydrothermalis]|uniref:GntR domain protein n=1 Tax=Maridesulfovibrio hydrothermalis AM13 = DSM 14728 TaxID=1121451 RepID=L0RFR9_9BACT|nr:FadR/GntR family transcriptional regulator [Maridesulfovibrio hydrothermalis]CCO25077.1 GntR domain protein [Maridesulfovibrio hydrothermalis AM13 = DSM 14728]